MKENMSSNVRRTVSNTSSGELCDVLHIRPESAGRAVEVDRLLGKASLNIEVCWDVYRGLARLCAIQSSQQSEKTPRLRAVIVCVDAIGPAELEFFSLTASHYRHVPVFVYGPKPHDFRLAKAIEAGARGRLEDDTIASIVAASPVTADNQTTDKPLSEVDEDPGAVGPDRGQSADSQGVSEDEPPILPIDSDTTGRAGAPAAGLVGAVLPAEKDDPEESSGVPVPWRRHGGRATRSAPGRTPPASTSADTGEPEAEASADQRPAAPVTSEPLLTEAELRALIGDDVSAIAPRGPADGRTTDEPNKDGLS